MTNIYESQEFSLLKDYSMHPGGLRLTDRAVRLAGLSKDMHVADIGCGAGSTAAYLAGKYGLVMTGLDISRQLIRAGLNKYPGLKFINMDCRTLPFKPQSLDAVLFECALSVIGYDDKTLEECACSLRVNGKIIISDLFAKKDSPDRSVISTFTRLESMLAATGFTVEVSEDHTPALITYAAEIYGQFGGYPEADRFLCSRYAGGFKISNHCYQLVIAKKIKE